MFKFIKVLNKLQLKHFKSKCKFNKCKCINICKTYKDANNLY